MWSRYFWLSAAERMIKTFAQTAVALLGGDTLLGLFDVDWPNALQVAGLAAVVSLLTSIASAGVGPDGSPSLVGEPPKQPAAVLEDAPPPAVEETTPSGRHVLDDDPDDIPVARLSEPRGYRTRDEIEEQGGDRRSH